MNKNILKQFQFGFEIEGVFNEKLSKLAGKFIEDGSVDTGIESDFDMLLIDGDRSDCPTCDGRGYTHEDCECECTVLSCEFSEEEGHAHSEEVCYVTPCYFEDDYHDSECYDCDGVGRGEETDSIEATEYTSPIFKSMESMLTHLRKFNSNSHAWNESCGLHLHISLKHGEINKLWNSVCNLEFMHKLHYAGVNSFCSCQEERLIAHDPQYYTFWEDSEDLIKCFKQQYETRDFSNSHRSSKFRFARFHEKLGTLEFRFLSPCQHKVINVVKLLSLLTDYLASKEEINANIDYFPLTDRKEVMDITYKVTERAF